MRPGDRVLLPCDTTDWIRYAVAWMAVLKVAAIAVPIAQSAGSERVIEAYRASRALGAVGTLTAELPGGWHTTIDELAAGQPTGGLDSPVTADSDAEISYTSGTTGLPKGVVATHANLLYPVMRSRSREPGIALHALPPGTTVGQGLLIQPLGPSPHSVLTLPRFAPKDLLRAIERHRPSHVVIVPAMAIALISAGLADSYDTSSVRQVRSTSAPIHPATLEQLSQLFPSARIRNVYSTTESWPRRLATDYDPVRPNSLGRPSASSQVRIVGPDGQPQPTGESGDVQLRSEAPQRRYDIATADIATAARTGDARTGDADDRTGDTSAVFLDDGWTRTGDIGRLDADGYFYLVDRNPDLINTGGLNVSTLSVEASIMEYPGVVEAAVCGVPHPVLTECVMAAVRAEPWLDTGSLASYLQDRQGPAAPHRIVVMDELPRNLLGKIDKRRLRTLLEDRLREPGHQAPATPTEQHLRTIWAMLLDLDVDQISATADFLQIGGSSLTAMEVVSHVADELGKKLRIRDVLDTTSLRELAQRVDSAAGSDSATLLSDSAGRQPITAESL